MISRTCNNQRKEATILPCKTDIDDDEVINKSDHHHHESSFPHNRGECARAERYTEARDFGGIIPVSLCIHYRCKVITYLDVHIILLKWRSFMLAQY